MATKLIVGINDLATVNPSLATEWNYVQNVGLRPEMVTAGSNRKVHWIGNCGHEWSATIASRNTGVGCPVCAREKNKEKIRQAHLRKKGSLQERNPVLAAEWHPNRNGNLRPINVNANSHDVVWWLGKCGHEWQASIKARNKGTRCPVCASSTVQTGENDLASRFPELLSEWDYEKNALQPSEVTAGSNRNAWWKCSNGHEWETTVKVRTTGRGCPYCSGNRLIPGGNDLQTRFPQIAKEWHSIKNGTLMPDMIAAGSHRKVWWKCNQGHEWQATPNHRTSKSRNCPYCCANPFVLPGVNDLATVNPKLAKEWNYERNGKLTPNGVTANSSRSVWWRCPIGHEWKTAVNHRADGSGCPKCANGKQTSFPEQAIFYYVSQVYPDAVNGYTELFNNHGMELDIYIPTLKIGIEYDGIAFHRSRVQKRREERKYSICHDAGITLVRIREDVNDSNETTSDFLILLTEGLDAGICALKSVGLAVSNVDVERDHNMIDACYRQSLTENSLQAKYPGIAAEWDYDLNEPLTPDMFLARSNRIAWWRCSLGHSWKAKLDSRVRGTGCPYCSNNKVLSGFNDLASKRPDLIREWDYALNHDIDPTSIAPGSGKKAWWKCEVGHSWRAEVSSRNKGHGCPYCAGNRR